MSEWPLARSTKLLVQPLGDELLLFDEDTHRAHSLNATAATVWQACDGRRDLGELAVECGIDEPTVSLALERLRAARLVEGAEAPADGVSRRLMIRKSLTAGAALGVAIPVIRSITAPTPALAASNGRVKGKAGQHCTSSAQCSPSPTSVCNTSPGFSSCQRPHGASCSHAFSCSHNGNVTLACRGGVCTTCTSNGQCPASYSTCASSGVCR